MFRSVWNLYLVRTDKPEPADNWNFLFPPTLGCTTELWIKNKSKLSLQTFSQKRSGQHLKCWDTSNKPAISSSYLSYCNPRVVLVFFMNYHEVASKLSDEKHQPLCVTVYLPRTFLSNTSLLCLWKLPCSFTQHTSQCPWNTAILSARYWQGTSVSTKNGWQFFFSSPKW